MNIDKSETVGEGATAPAVDKSTDVDESNVNNQETKGEGQEQETGTETTSKGEEGKEPELTEKGTKLDPNPQSAVHQELANTKAKMKQMEQILTNPELLKRYAAQNNMTLTEAKAEIKEEKEEKQEEVKDFTPDDFKTAGDVASALNEMRKSLKETKEENQRLREGQKGITSSRKTERIANNMQRDITTVRERYPELNPTSPDFDRELEGEIGSLYQRLDFDQATNAPRGKVSLVAIADSIMKAAGRAKKTGSQEAQTDVRVKQAGKVTSGKGTSKDVTESKDPGTVIAQRINKALTG